MAYSVGNYTLARKISDPQFSVDHIDQYDLLLLAGQYDFQFAVVDALQQRCLLVEDYTFSNAGTDVGETYRTLIEEHQLLMAGYWNRVKLAIKSQHFTLVPSTYFSAENAAHYLTLVTNTPSNKYSINHYRFKELDAVMVFGAEKQLVERLRSTYPSQDVGIISQGSAFIEGVRQVAAGSYYRNMYLFIDQQHVSVVVLEDQKLVLYNRFVYQTPNDIVKYVLTVFQKLEMDQNETKVTVWGNFTEQSEQYAALYQYIRELNYGTKPDFLKFSHMFDEAPDHQYFDLYSMYLSE
ncbi:MAG: DUF3822 family protein [Cyclobacteriaceae bacterium]